VAHGITAQCRPCLWILRDMCMHGNDPRLCDLFVRYACTGDSGLVAEAAAVARPEVLEAARRRAVEAGIVPKEALL
jgi:hypothetical protein